ncbi:MAG: hypothetical protein LCH88_01280 [Proteobacteria bacterium]|nr:hypothetical protein [Pseudomonadota bacterium]
MGFTFFAPDNPGRLPLSAFAACRHGNANKKHSRNPAMCGKHDDAPGASNKSRHCPALPGAISRLDAERRRAVSPSG